MLPLSWKEVLSYLARLFEIADVDRDGVLNRDEWATILARSEFGFSNQLIEELMFLAGTSCDLV